MKFLNLFSSFYYKLSIEERRFIKLNKSYWKDITGSYDSGQILVEGFLSVPRHLFQTGRIAKAIEEETNFTPIVLMDEFSGDGRNNKKKIYESFSIKNFIYLKRELFSLSTLISSIYNSIKFIIKFRNSKEMLEEHYLDIKIGDLIYDTIIRSNEKTYTIDRVSIKCFRYIFYSYHIALRYKKILDRHNFKYLIISHTVYATFGILARMCQARGIHVLLTDGKHIKSFKEFDIEEHRLQPSKTEVYVNLDNTQLINEIEDYLEKRFQGNVNQHDVKNAFVNKRQYSKNQLIKELKINTDLPIVFIMAHAFTDCPHCSKSMVYKDYYSWLVNTIKIVSNLKNANWIVKPHPSAHMYNEVGVVEDLVKDFKGVYLAPNDLNTASIKEAADYIVTVQGTAGLEFSCFGIPTVITGKAFYSGYGFTIEPKTESEYIEVLSNIDKYKKLNEDEKKIAKVILAMIRKFDVEDNILPNIQVLPGDDFKIKSQEVLKEINDALMNNDPKEDNFYYHVKGLI